MASPKPSNEIYQENIRLRERNEALEQGRHVDEDSGFKRKCWKECFGRRRGIILVLVLIVSIILMCYVFYQASVNREILISMRKDNEQNQRSPLLGALTAGGVSSGINNYMKLGIRQDFLIQECQGSELKQSFPDMDYSMLGYNILRGYPLAIGHDPGFTLPIFSADYSEGKNSADCRYSIPKGVFLAPDVSCVTSFSSTVTQTRFEFASSLAVSAHVSGGGWGLSFSASAGYKESSSQIASGESVFILSTASCTNYFSKLMKKTPPPLHPVFIKWIDLLAKTNDKDTYMAFFDTFGTHFPTMVTYGARYTYQYKMSSSAYETSREKGVNVAAEASYSGLFSVGGGFGMDSSQRESASSFSKSVETKTITVGAPPPSNGDAMTWASEVKTSPVPVRYNLESIENLFTDDFMETQPVHTSRIVENIKKYKYEYCKMLKQKGETNSCEDVKPGLELQKSRLYNHFKEMWSTLPECIEQCLQNIYCSAITYCTTCTSTQTGFRTCYMYREDQSKETVSGTVEEGWVSNVFLAKIKDYLILGGIKLIGTPRSMDNPADDKADFKTCQEICSRDTNCVAFTYCKCPDKTVSCEIYDARNINGIEDDSAYTTVFVPTRAYTKPDK